MQKNRAGAARSSAQGNPLQMSLWAPREAEPGWNVRISRRARRLSMRVFPGGRVEVVVPPGVGIPAIERFVSRSDCRAIRTFPGEISNADVISLCTRTLRCGECLWA